MCSFEYRCFTFNFIEENTYIIWSARTREVAIIDCGARHPEEQRYLTYFITSSKLRPVAALLTHAHFDHIFGLQTLYDTFGLRPRMHEKEHANYDMAAEQTELFLHRRLDFDVPPAGPDLHDGEEIPVGDLRLKVIETPGHTEGGVCFFLTPSPEDPPATKPLLFSGDTLFRNSVGRTDLPGGSWMDMEKSIHKCLHTLPENTLVLPGHGETTTIKSERILHGIGF